LKFNYGLTENQLYRYVKERRRRGVTGLILLQLLEMLRYSLFRIGFAKLLLARQLVNHGHITINNKVVSKFPVSIKRYYQC
jgi:small subunit ribosomal protein S4